MKKTLLTERFQELAGIKTLSTENNEKILKEGDIKSAITDLMSQMGVDKAIWEPKTHLLDKSIKQKSDWKEKLGALSTWIADVTGGKSTTDTASGDKGSEKFGSSHIGMKADDKPSSTTPTDSSKPTSAVTT
jgi:hypothetical protein